MPIGHLLRNTCCLLSLWAGFSAPNAQAQTRPELGEVQEAKITIEKEKVIVLPEADREFQSTAGEEGQLDKVSIDSIAIKQFITTKPVDLKPRLVQLRDEGRAAQKKSYLEAGFGNYITTLFTGAYYGNLSNDVTIGIGGAHRNSANGPAKKSNSGTNRFFGSLDYQTNKSNIHLEPYYEWNRNRFYGGFTPTENKSEPDLQQHKSIGVLAQTNFRIDKSANRLDVGVNRYANSFTQNEIRFNVYDSLQLRFDKRTHSISGGVDLASLNYGPTNIQVAGKTAYAANVGYHTQYTWNQIEFKPGLRADFYTRGGKNKVWLIPQLEAAYRINDSASIFVVLSSGARLNSLYTLSGVNPFINDSTGVQATIQKMKLGIGAAAQLGALLSARVQGGVSILQGLSGFENNGDDSTRFDVVYYNDNVTSFYANIGLRLNPSRQFVIGYDVALRTFAMDNLVAPLGIARVQHQFTAAYNLGGNDKLYFDAQLLVAGKRQALVDSRNSMVTGAERKIVNLKVFPDLGLGVRYKWSDKVSLFVRGENLLNQKQPLYYDYRSRGLTVLGGFTLSL